MYDAKRVKGRDWMVGRVWVGIVLLLVVELALEAGARVGVGEREGVSFAAAARAMRLAINDVGEVAELLPMVVLG